MKKASKEINYKKATGDDDVLGDVGLLKLLEEDCLKIMTPTDHNTYETGKFTQGFHWSSNDCLKQEPKIYKKQSP